MRALTYLNILQKPVNIKASALLIIHNGLNAYSFLISSHIGRWVYTTLSCGWRMYRYPDAGPSGATATNRCGVSHC